MPGNVDRGGFAVTDVEEVGIEAGDVIDEGAPLGDRPAGHAGLRVVVLLGVPPFQWDFGNQVVTAEQGFPQLLWRTDPAR